MHFMKPRLSEKAFAMSQATNTFVFDVPKDINKLEVIEAITKQFDVKITSVRFVNRPGKAKRVMNLTGKRSSNRSGTQSDLRKAYVTLAKDSHLPFFEAEETEVAEAAKVAEKAKAKKTDKKTTDEKVEKTVKAEKPAKKETK